MENTPQSNSSEQKPTPLDQNDAYGELTEISGSELSEPTADTAGEPAVTETAMEPEIADKGRDKLKILKDIGFIAVASAFAYGAFKSGQLDHVPIASEIIEKGEIPMGVSAVATGFMASRAGDVVNVFRKK